MNVMTKKTHIIFDFDGTIADSIPVMFTIVGELAQKIGYEKTITESDWQWVREHGLKEIPRKFNIPLIKIPYLFMEGRRLMKAQMFSVPPCKGIVETLQNLKKKGYSLAILSSSNRDILQEFILRYDIASLFDFVHSELNIFGKDKALTSLMKQYKIPLSEAVYVGDELRDIEASRAIGLDIISVGWGLNAVDLLELNNPGRVVQKPRDIADILTLL